MTAPAAHPLIAELRRIREGQGITRRLLADRLGLHHMTVYFWEHGERRPTPSELCRWAAALDHDIALQPRAKASVS